MTNDPGTLLNLYDPVNERLGQPLKRLCGDEADVNVALLLLSDHDLPSRCAALVRFNSMSRARISSSSIGNVHP